MRKFLFFIVLCLLSVSALMAQKTVSGTVTDQASGEPIEGVAVVAYGTTIGTYTNEEGKYSLEIPDDADRLIFRFVGRATREVEIGNQTTVNVELSEDFSLDEVVVTALGIRREEKSLGYAVQEVAGDALTSARETNIATALSGKVAGVQVISSSGAQLGGSTNIRIRGSSSLEGGQPLYVVDGTPIANDNFSAAYRGSDYGNLASDINLDDVESISVLKGPSATALYGNRAANGVILITTKKGTARKGIGVSLNSSVEFQNVYVLPEYQNEYAGGYSGDFSTYNDGTRDWTVLNYAADESWGPKIDGRMYRPWYSWYPNHPDYGKEVPLTAQPDNVRNFFETGQIYNNSLAFYGGNQSSSFRLSYNNVTQTGIIPNSKLVRNNIGLNAESELAKGLKVMANLNFANNEGTGRPKFGYEGSGNNPVMSFNQWFQRQLDMDKLRDYKDPDGTFRTWNIRSPENLRPLYWDSPFFSVNENFSTDRRDRYFGHVGIRYEVMDGLTVTGLFRRDFYNQRIEERIATGGLEQDYYREFVAQGAENNYEFLIHYDKRFGDFSVDANLGGNIRQNKFHSNDMSTAGGLNAPNLFNISASVDRPNTTSFISEKVVRSLYGFLNLGYKDFLFLDFTLRNDWSSALPANNNSYLYPSASLSFIFSELIGADVSTFSLGKFRASFAQVGSDIDPYQTAFAYNRTTPYGNVPAFSLPTTLPNEDLRPALSTNYEFGLDLRFFNNRLGLDATYYKNQAKDQILTLQIPGSSGFQNAIINAGNITSEGFELAMYATPVKTQSFTWDLTFNFARNVSKVIELTEGLDTRLLDNWGWGGFAIYAREGQPWGMMIGRAFERYQATDAEGNEIADPNNGQFVINEDGSYQVALNQELGGILPDFTGGFRNVFNFKGFELMAFVDFQIGGQFHSVTRMFNAYSGLGIETVGNNDKGNPIRNAAADGGGVKVEGVLEDGTPHTAYVDAITHFGGLFALHENWIYDASFVKLRELSFGYNFPRKMLSNTPIQNLSLSFIGRNLWLIHSNVDGIDPSEISPGSNPYVFQENGILPGVRSFGFNLKIGF